MNKLIFILVLVTTFTFAQSDTVKVKPNAVQMNIVNDLEKKLAQAEAELNRLKEQHKNSVELIIGVRIEEIEYLNYKHETFEYILKLSHK